MPRIKIVEQDRRGYELFRKAFGYNMKTRRRALKMPIARFAFYLGVSKKFAKRLEDGERLPRLPTAYRISIILQCKLSDLVPRTPVIAPVKKKRGKFIDARNQVRKRGTCIRSHYYRKQKERGFAYPVGWMAKKNNEAREKAKRERLASEKAASVKKKTGSVRES